MNKKDSGNDGGDCNSSSISSFEEFLADPRQREVVPLVGNYSKAADDDSLSSFEEVLHHPSQRKVVQLPSNNTNNDNSLREEFEYSNGGNDDDSDSDDVKLDGSKVEPPHESDSDGDSNQFDSASEASSVNIDEGIKLDDDMMENHGFTDLSTTASSLQKKIANSHIQLNNNGTHSMEAAYAKSDELTKPDEKHLTDMDKFHKQVDDDKERDPKAFNKRYGRYLDTSMQFLVFNIDGNLLLAVARTLCGNVDGISGANYKKGTTKKADDSLVAVCGRPHGGYPTFPKEGYNRANLYLIFEITGMSVKEIAQLITGRRVEEESLLTLCQSVLEGTADYSRDQFLDKLASEAGKNNTIYKDLKSRQPKAGSPPATYHAWVYTLTKDGKKGNALYGIIKVRTYFGTCIGYTGGRGRTDKSLGNIKVGKGNGREWKNSRGGDSFNGFWIEMLESKTDEWYKEKDIRFAPPCDDDFSTLTPKPLADLDLADLESE